MARETFTVEHKTPWLDSADPVSLFFDLDNIGFSHSACNSGAARKSEERAAKCGTRSKYVAGCRCDPCRESERVSSAKRYTPEWRRDRYKRTGK